jgi:hypothetical protein
VVVVVVVVGGGGRAERVLAVAIAAPTRAMTHARCCVPVQFELQVAIAAMIAASSRPRGKSTRFSNIKVSVDPDE